MKKATIMLTIMILLVGCGNSAIKESPLTPMDELISSETASEAESINDKISSELSDGASFDDIPENKETVFATLEETFSEITKTPRRCGTDGEKRAMDYIVSQMKSFGYDITVQQFDIFDRAIKNVRKNDLYFDFEMKNQEPVSQGSNIIADLNYDENKKTIVFSAHYDTVANSLGALDNGSGTAALLEAAKLISKQSLDYNIRIIFFSAEEYGLYGSRYYVSELSDKELSSIAGCLNIDVVGAKDCRKILLQTYQPEDRTGVQENWITKEYGRINGEYELRHGRSSDHSPFVLRGIKAVQLATVDPRDEKFDKDLLGKEEDTSSVSLENLQADTRLIFEFMKNVDILAQ